jgi:putative tricarboxylic transport membrane protein
VELQHALSVFQYVFEPANLGILALSVFFGMIVGILPGLTATMAVALLTGLTYRLAPEMAVLSLIGVYIGAISGGCQSAILMNIPGTPASAATAVDGFPIGRKGEGGLGIFLAETSSCIGTLTGTLCVLLLTPPLSALALNFGAYEFFLLAVFGVMICGQLTAGADALKGWISGVLGLLVAMIGLDGINSYPRFAFDNVNLMGGIPLIPVMIGLFGFPEIVYGLAATISREQIVSSSLQMLRGTRIMLQNKLNVVRSSVIGVVIGIIPGVGEDVAGWLSYWAEKSANKDKEKFGKGAYEGVIAAETGNNACIGGAIIPVLALAVPGSAPAAVLLAALWLHGLHPGPMLMQETPGFVVTISIYMAVSAVLMWFIGLSLAKVTTRILAIKSEILMPVIYLICAVGSYVIDNNVWDIYIMFVFGILGLLMREMKYPAAPFLLGIILGPMADTSLRRALILSGGDPSPFFTRPLSLIFLAGILLMVLSQMNVGSYLRKLLSHDEFKES